LRKVGRTGRMGSEESEKHSRTHNGTHKEIHQSDAKEVIYKGIERSSDKQKET